MEMEDKELEIGNAETLRKQEDFAEEEEGDEKEWQN